MTLAAYMATLISLTCHTPKANYELYINNIEKTGAYTQVGNNHRLHLPRVEDKIGKLIIFNPYQEYDVVCKVRKI